MLGGSHIRNLPSGCRNGPEPDQNEEKQPDPSTSGERLAWLSVGHRVEAALILGKRYKAGGSQNV